MRIGAAPTLLQRLEAGKHRDISHAGWAGAPVLGAFNFSSARLKEIRSERPAIFHPVVYKADHDPVAQPYFYPFFESKALTQIDVSRINGAKAAGFMPCAETVRAFIERESDDVCLPETMDDRYWEVVWLTSAASWRRILRTQISIENHFRLVKQMPSRLSAAGLRRNLPRLLRELPHIPSHAVVAFVDNFTSVAAKNAFVIRDGDKTYPPNGTLVAVWKALSADV